MADGRGLAWLLYAGIGLVVAGLSTCTAGVIDENSSPAAALVPGGGSIHGVLFIAVGPDGALYRTEGDNADQIVRVESDGRTTVVASGIKNLGGIAVDGHRNVFVSEDPGGGAPSTIPGGEIVEFRPDGTQQLVATMASPTTLAVDEQGVIYVVDSLNVEKVIAGAPPQMVSQDPQIDASAVAVGPSGDLYISDGEHNAVWRRDPSGHLQLLARPGLVQEPTYLAVDGLGNVYICQTSFAVTPLGVFGSQRAFQVPVLIIDSRGAIHRLGVRGDASIFATEDLAVSPAGDLYLNDGSSVSKLRAPVQLVPVETRKFWPLILALGAVLIGVGLALAGSALLIRAIEAWSGA
jgi:sugar lactone lactonase YvrE